MVDLSYRPSLDAVLSERGRFSHREHLELAWRYLREADLAVAQLLMSAAIRHVARSHGAPDRYHHTITMTWFRLLATHFSGSDDATFDEFIEHNPRLLDKHLLERHFSDGLLKSPAARQCWVEPDLVPLPSVP